MQPSDCLRKSTAGRGTAMQRPCVGRELEQSRNSKEVSRMGVVCKEAGEEEV